MRRRIAAHSALCGGGGAVAFSCFDLFFFFVLVFVFVVVVLGGERREVEKVGHVIFAK